MCLAIGENGVTMVTLKDELNGLKADFLSLQNFLKEKITSIEFKINDIENKMCVEYSSRNEIASGAAIVQELDNQTRNIIEELMWESTLSQSALRVRELFRDSNSREKFLRCCLELVLEKDEQYRKMAGTLFGHLISQNIINQTNVFNSLSPVLLVIENSNNYDTKMWRNLTEILLPMIMDSHIKLLQVQRKAQTILKQEYYREFLDHLCCAVESSRKHKFKHKSAGAPTPLAQSTTFAVPAAVGGAAACDKRDFNMELAEECAGDLQNLYDIESMSKFKPCFDNLPLDEPHPPAKYDVERLVDNLAPNNVDDAVRQLKQVEMAELKTAIEDLIDHGVQKEPEQRLLIGSVLAGAVGAKVFDSKLVVCAFCKCIFKLQRLIVNQNTRVPTCAAFIDMLLPLFGERHLKFGQLSAVASMALPEETKTIFLWFMERALNEKGLSETATTMQPSAVTAKLMKRMRKFMGKSAAQPTDDEQDEIGDVPTVSDRKAVAAPAAVAPRGRVSPMRSERREPMKAYAAPAPAQPSVVSAPPKHEPDANVEEQSEHDKFLNLKRQKLLKERIENAGDKLDIKIEDLLSDPNKKLQDGDLGGDPQLRPDGPKAEVEQAPAKQPENLPSSAIKEKMQEIIEHLMETGNMEECVSTVKETFNE